MEAEDGIQALRLVESEQVGCIVSDWNMPKMNGIELLKAVRAHQSKGEMPFLIVTAEAKKENIVEAVRAGADGYIVKPFTVVTLREKLAKVLLKHHIDP